MIRKKSAHILILSVAVLMVLLRPYAAYRLSGSADFVANPIKVNDMQQRLVKKKGGHYGLVERETKTTIALPAIRLLFNQKQGFFATGLLKLRINTVFHIIHKNKPYLLLSRLQV